MIAVLLACLSFQDPREVPTAGKHESLLLRPCRREARHYENLARWAGGGRGSDLALLSALDWLSRHQEADGSWEGSIETTSAALLAFLGAGFTTWPQEDCRAPSFGARSVSSEALRRIVPYSQAVRRGIAFLLRSQDSSGFIGTSVRTHAIATKGLCDAYGWAPLLILREPTESAVRALERAAIPGEDDAAVGWAALASRSAALGLLPSFRPAEAPSTQRSAIGLLVWRLARRPERIPVPDVAAWKADKSDPEARYWITAALFSYDGPGGPIWNRWVRDLLNELLSRQDGRTGDERGSWAPVGRTGRAAATAIHALCLAVWYEPQIVAGR